MQVKAIRLNPKQPFQWSSGWLSPIYCDNRLTLSYPSVRSFVKQEIISVIHERYGQTESIAGVATAGIPQATLVADRLRLPLLYVRSASKGHGLRNRIEGQVVEGQKVVVIEDLISTGKSSVEAADSLRAAGLDVLGVVAIFTYGFPQAEEAFQKADLSYCCLSDYDTMLEVATAQNYVPAEALDSLNRWRENPAAWSPRTSVNP
ncbi:MAG: orotate phosphoribosyltransferase [Catalinimonas sp.]